VPVSNAYDINRDARVNALDLAATRAGQSQTLSLSEAPAAAIVAASSLVRGEPRRRRHY
jgi:hypothetical protein